MSDGRTTSDDRPSAISSDPGKSKLPSAIQPLENPVDPIAQGRQGLSTAPAGALDLKPGMEQLDESGEPVKGLRGITPVEPATSDRSMRMQLAANCVRWCEEHKIPPNPIGVITALQDLGKLNLGNVGMLNSL